MDAMSLVDATREAIATGAVLLAPAVISAFAIGTLLSLFQAATQIQDQAISFVPKLVVVSIVILLLLPWMTEYFVEYTRGVISQIPLQILGR